jgi:hypothetical protein
MWDAQLFSREVAGYTLACKCSVNARLSKVKVIGPCCGSRIDVLSRSL